MIIDDSKSVIELKGVTKGYSIYARSVDRVKEALHPLRRKYHRRFNALSDISFSVRKGETLGIIGSNGSGKSTLLQILCHVLSPTMGSVRVAGRVAALLELGTGFNSEFSGRDNVYMNSRILGLSQREIDLRFDSIIEFSGIRDFIEQPLRTYSSGMVVRLAFAVMIHVDADILVIDEALAVGDEAFQRKCHSFLAAFIERGNTLVFVSHAPQMVIELCDRALLLDAGKLILDDTAKNVVQEYHRRIYSPGGGNTAAQLLPQGEKVPAVPALKADDEIPRSFLDPEFVSQSVLYYEEKGAKIERIRMLSDREEMVNCLFHGGEYIFAYDVDFLADARRVVFGSMLKSITGLELGGVLSHPQAKPIPHVKAGTRIAVRFRFYCWLAPGVYFFNAGLMGDQNGENGYLHRIVDALMFRVQPVESQRFTGMVDFSQQGEAQIRMQPPAEAVGP